MKGLSDVNETCTRPPLPWHNLLENYLNQEQRLNKSYDRLTESTQSLIVYYKLTLTANRQDVVAQWLRHGDLQRLDDVISIPDVGSIPVVSFFIINIYFP